MRAAPGTRQPGCLSYKEIRTPSSWLLKRDNVPSEFGGELQGAGELPQIGGLAATVTGAPGSVEMEGGCLSAGMGSSGTGCCSWALLPGNSKERWRLGCSTAFDPGEWQCGISRGSCQGRDSGEMEAYVGGFEGAEGGTKGQ